MNLTQATPTFDNRLGYRDIITAASLLLAVGGGLWKMGEQAAEFRAQIARQSTEFAVAVGSVKQEFDYRMSAVEKLSVQYVPIIQSLEKSDLRQEDRIQSVATAIQDIRKTNSELLTQMGAVRETLAELKTLSRPRLN